MGMSTLLPSDTYTMSVTGVRSSGHFRAPSGFPENQVTIQFLHASEWLHGKSWTCVTEGDHASWHMQQRDVASEASNVSIVSEGGES